MGSRPRKLIIGATLALLFVLVGGRTAAEFAVTFWWYRALGYPETFWTQWNTALAVRGITALGAGAFVFINLWLVARSFGTIRVRRRYANIEIAEQLPRGYLAGALFLLALASAWWLSGGIGDPIAVRAALRPVSWGISDPEFGRDLSFYVLRYPVLDRLQTLTGILLFWTLLLTAVGYTLSGGLRWSDAGLNVSVTARRHLGDLFAGLFIVLAWDAWLDRYNVLITGDSFAGQPGYSDVVGRIPGTMVVAALAVIAAASVAAGAWRGRLRLPVLGVGALLVGALMAQAVIPTLLQRFRVEPDQFEREQRFIGYNIEFTRAAFGLSGLAREALPWGAADSLRVTSLQSVLAGVPLWDPRPLLQAWAPQALFGYYDFSTAHYDRYGPLGRAEQVAIAVRELEADSLPSRTWQNLHLRYVAGTGAVVSPVSRISGSGEPLYYVRDIPPRRYEDAPPALELTQPSVFYGEHTREYAIIQPAERGAAANGGVRLDGFWKKLAFAWAFQDKNLLLAGEVTDASRILYRRTVRDRAAAAAPFLFFPDAPGAAYPVVSDGRVVWMLDGYTLSRTVPFSAAFPLVPGSPFGVDGVRYIRNSVKATVDGLTGQLAFYVVDEWDPVLRTYRTIFPELFRPIEEMPSELRRHLRFPEMLLGLQARVLREYHLTEPRAFYTKEDVWAIPTELYRDQTVPVDPAYAMLPLPGGGSREFLLALPFVARGRQNLTALLIARNDPPHYGEQIVFELPRDELIPGPQQIEAMIDQDPEISEQLSLWKRGGSDVIRGHLLTVPVDSTLVYIEPVYLEAQESAIPQLERVIVGTRDRVVMRPTLEGAIEALLGSVDVTESTDDEIAETTPRDGAANPRLVRARRLLNQAEAQLRAGDWAGFGRTWRELEQTLNAAPLPDEQP